MRKRLKLSKVAEENFWVKFNQVHNSHLSTNVGFIKVITEEDKD